MTAWCCAFVSSAVFVACIGTQAPPVGEGGGDRDGLIPLEYYQLGWKRDGLNPFEHYHRGVEQGRLKLLSTGVGSGTASTLSSIIAGVWYRACYTYGTPAIHKEGRVHG